MNKKKRKMEKQIAENEVKVCRGKGGDVLKKKANRRRRSRGGGGAGGPCGDSEVFSHSGRSTGVAVASLGTGLLQDKD